MKMRADSSGPVSIAAEMLFSLPIISNFKGRIRVARKTLVPEVWVCVCVHARARVCVCVCVGGGGGGGGGGRGGGGGGGGGRKGRLRPRPKKHFINTHLYFNKQTTI